MERNKEEELKQLEQKEAAEKEKPPKEDKCPVCLQQVDTYPYLMVDPIRGWIECAVCGNVFSPRSLMRTKLAKSQSIIKPVKKLIVPAT